jgi:hypothetical protein
MRSLVLFACGILCLSASPYGQGPAPPGAAQKAAAPAAADAAFSVEWRHTRARFDNDGLSRREETYWVNRNRAAAAVGHLVMGAATGAVSLLVFRSPLVAHRPIRGMSLLLAPIATGGVLELLGRWWVRRGNVLMALFTFCGGFCFALGMALVRFAYLHR